jgi:hypothetical protein
MSATIFKNDLSLSVTKHMKIAFICHDANLTGAPKLGFDVANYMSRNNEVVMIVKKDGPLLRFPEYKSAFSNILNVNTSHEVAHLTLSQRLAIARDIIREEKPDLLYVNSVASSDWCAAGKECNIPVVLHSHEMRNELLSLESINIFKRDLPRYVDLLITVSDAAEADIIEQCSLPFKRIFSSKAGVNFQKIGELANVRDFEQPKNIFDQKLQNDKPLISMCGIASKRKGSDIFFQVAKHLGQFNFLWIGPWNSGEAFGNIALNDYRKNTIENFYTTNETHNPYPYFKLTDLFVLTSREDPNPLVVMEAIFLSKLCMGFSNTGGSKHLLNRFGVLLQGEITVERLTSIIKKILQDPLTEFISEERKRSFSEEYDIESIARTIEMEISSLVKNPITPA